jgi:hypothetical protein
MIVFHEFSELRQFAVNRFKDEKKNGLLKVAGTVGGVGLIAKSLPAATGHTVAYHGTDADGAAGIKKEGIRARVHHGRMGGGTDRAINDRGTVSTADVKKAVKDSKGLAFLTKNPAQAALYGSETASKNGSTPRVIGRVVPTVDAVPNPEGVVVRGKKAPLIRVMYKNARSQGIDIKGSYPNKRLRKAAIGAQIRAADKMMNKDTLVYADKVPKPSLDAVRRHVVKHPGRAALGVAGVAGGVELLRRTYRKPKG